jgi:hypothetical protein
MEDATVEVPAVTGTLDLYVAEINKFPILSADEEFSLAVRLKNIIQCRPRRRSSFRTYALS